jgi:NHL repeat
MIIHLHPLKPALTLIWFTVFMGVLKADFKQGQIPEFILGTGQWNERQLFHVDDVAVDPISGKVFISDATTHRVLRFPASVSSSLLAINPAEAEAVLGQSSFFETGPGYFAAGLNSPSGLAFDPAGNLYVADSGNHRVVRFSGAGEAATGAASDWVLGQASLSGNAEGNGPAAFRDPQGIAILGGYLAVADTGNHRVQVFHNFQTLPSGASASQSYGSGSAGRSATSFNQPRSIAISSYGNLASPKQRLWVADTGNNRILRFDELSGISVINGIQYDKTADGVLGQADFNTDNRGSVPTTTNLSAHSLLASGLRLYVGDSIFSRVLRYENAGAKGDGAAADGVLGQSSLTSSDSAVAGQGVALAGAALWSTTAIGASRFDSGAGNAVASPHSRILASPVTTTGVNFPLMAEDQLLHKCYVYEPVAVRLIRRYASCAAFRAGQPPEFTFSAYLSSLVQTGTTLGGLAAHGGHLTLSDTTKHRVIDITNAAVVSTTIPAQVTIIGQLNPASVTPGLNDAGLTRMKSPTALCWATAPDHRALRLYVADTGNHRVLSYTPVFPGIAEIFGGEDGVSGVTSSRLYQPQGLAYDMNSGLLYVADTGNHRLLQFQAFTTASASAVTPGAAIGVLGQSSFTTAITGSGPNQLSGPESLALSPLTLGNTSEIFVMDRGNNRVAMFHYNHLIVPPPPLLIHLTFNTPSTSGNSSYPYPSSRNLAISTTGSLMLELSDLKNPRSLWISGDQRVTWFQRDYTPTVLEASNLADTFSLRFSKRPFYDYEISTSSDLQPMSWRAFIKDFSDGATRGTHVESMQGRPRQFYRIREISGID